MSDEPSEETVALVRRLLAVAGLSPGEDEVRALAGSYPALRQRVASLYQVDGARCETPAPTFRA
jgi:hypothetical protein